jgi:hypothetical protein
MTHTTLRRKAVALCLMIAVMNLYSAKALGSPARSLLLGELTTMGQVTVNGAEAISGMSVFPDSTITTAVKSGALLSLGKLGRVELLQSSNANVTFDAAGVAGVLDTGGVRASVPAGISARVAAGAVNVTSAGREGATFLVEKIGDRVTVSAQAGKIEVSEGGKQFALNAGEFFASGMVAPELIKDNDNDSDKRKRAAAIIIGVGAAIAAIIFVVTREANQETFIGGGNIAPSANL